MSFHTRSQKLAQTAYPRVAERAKQAAFGEYTAFAKKFPALVHTCGLAQAVAFAAAKDSTGYLADLAAVLTADGHERVPDAASLAELTRTAPMSAYLRLTRDALDAAVWLKRYVEAVATSPTTEAAKEAADAKGT